MRYTINNAVFIASMYSGKVTLKDGEQHCPYCDGYAIKPVFGERGTHEDCTHCDKTGKIAAFK